MPEQTDEEYNQELKDLEAEANGSFAVTEQFLNKKANRKQKGNATQDNDASLSTDEPDPE